MNRRSTYIAPTREITDAETIVLNDLDFDIPCGTGTCQHPAAWKYSCTGCGASYLCCEPHRNFVFAWEKVSCLNCELKGDRIWDIFKWVAL